MKMKMRIWAILLCGLFTLPLLGLAMGDESRQEERFDPSVFSNVDAYIAREMERQSLPGLSLGIVQGDRILYLKGYGQADSSGRPVTPETPFGLGSIGKAITAMAVLQLVETGKIDLDAPVQRYIPAMYKGAEFVSVRQLLNQTSGFTQMATFGNMFSSGHEQDALENNAMSYAEKFLQQAHPNEHSFRYSNANYVLLGYMVQQVSGQPYGEYVKAHIFQPLSMHNSFVTLDEARGLLLCSCRCLTMHNSFVTLDEAVAHGVATPYRRIFGFNVAYEGPYVYVPGDVPAGYLYSSAKDISHYLISQMNGGRFEDHALLSPESVRLMQTEPVPGTYAMGWMNGHVNEVSVIGHPGSLIGFQSHTWIAPEQKLGVIVFANVLDAIDVAFPEIHIMTTTYIASGVINILNAKPVGGAGLSITQKYWMVNGLLLLFSAWLLYAIVRTAKRSFGPWKSDSSGSAERSVKAILRIVLEFTGLLIVLILSLTHVVPVWHIATIYQPDIVLWLKVMAVLVAVKGGMDTIQFIRAIRHGKTAG